MDGRKRIRLKPPLCLVPHEWGDFIPHNVEGAVKVCLHCPAVLTKKEFLASKPVINVMPKAREMPQFKEHLNLMGF